MAMDCVQYFKLMKWIVHGTAYVPLEYDTEFGRRWYRDEGLDGQSVQCPKCKVWYRSPKPAESRCPCCNSPASDATRGMP
jgi:ssDNA-binding Zn-finger/Zn-ribbon topoisomerase 1